MKIVYNGEMDSRLCKEVIGATIAEIVDNDPNTIYLDADLMSCDGTLKWGKANPTRAIDCGIAEANMAGVAAGLCVAGFRPIMHTFGPFASRRCYDQIFLSGGYAKNDITVIGTDPGVTATMNGGTHMPFEDVALYNVLPHSTIIDVSDPNCLISVLKQCVYRPGIKYIRVGRKKLAKIYEDGAELEIGKAVTLREGTDAVVFAAGIMLHEAMKAAASLEKQGISVAVVDCFTIKPIDADAVAEWAGKTGAVVVAENANRHGGLYDTILEVLGERCPVPAACVAVEDEFGEVGTQDYLQERFGLTAQHIEEQLKAVIARKK
ncbi:MAG: transketolase family protein [Oscillospiraceae bacterium]|nr:transketolase family protein [Oscillospiraceae bacterium]MBR3178241.1 transketolase family protein [Clostridia bacterium]